MHSESEQYPSEVKQLGNVEIERTVDGTVLRIGTVPVGERDRVIIVQRHQKPGSFGKEDLLATGRSASDPSNLDYTYDPEATAAGSKSEDQFLSTLKGSIGEVDLVATTPMKRGNEQKDLLLNSFPDAAQNEHVDQLLKDAEIGLLGESAFGAFSYSQEETMELFNPAAQHEARFGRGSYDEKRQPFSYMQAWINQAYLNPDNRWKVESPEELEQRTKELFQYIKPKNLLLTHEANCLAFHLLAARKPEELQAIINQIELPHHIKEQVEIRLASLHTIGALLDHLRQTLSSDRIPGFHYKKVLAQLIELVRLKSGDKDRGYGAFSVYVLQEHENEEPILIEAAYDQQVS